MNELTPVEALQILDNIAAASALTRTQHIAAQQAVETLRNLIGATPSDGARDEEVPERAKSP